MPPKSPLVDSAGSYSTRCSTPFRVSTYGSARWRRDTARIPWGERNSASSSMEPSTRGSWSRDTMARRRRSPTPGFAAIATCSRNSGWLSTNHCIRRVNPLSLSTTSGSSVSTAKSGISPTMERAFSRQAAPSVWRTS